MIGGVSFWDAPYPIDMKVCHIITKPELGGAQLSTLSLLLNLPKDKYDIIVITSLRGILASEFKMPRIKTIFSPFLIRRINPIVDIFAFIHILVIYISNKCDIVHTHSSKAGILGRWAAKLSGVKKIVHTVHGWSFNDFQPLLARNFFIFLERLTAKVTDKIICVSMNDIETGLKYKIASKDKFVLIRYGIQLSDFRGRAAANLIEKKRELGIRNTGHVIGMISCLKAQKSPLDFVRSAIEIHSKMPDVNFLLVGDGVLKEKCKRLLSTTSLNGNFVFAGWRRDISEILDIIDIIVLTSKWEGTPITVIEALSKGKPVVVTDAGGTRELIKDGVTGYVTKPGVYSETAGKVLKILRDKDLFSRMKKQASLSIDDSFSIDRMVKDIDKLYTALI